MKLRHRGGTKTRVLRMMSMRKMISRKKMKKMKKMRKILISIWKKDI